MKRADFLQRLIGVAIFGKLPISTLITKRKVYLLQCFVAGFRHYKGMELLEEMEVNDLLELSREPDNVYDDFAIALYWQQEKIGFIPAEFNETIARLLDAEALPLLASITHLKKDVKPWENVVVAVYFLQEEKVLPPHADYLQKLEDPVYKTETSQNKNLMDDLYNTTNRIIYVPTIPDKKVAAYYEKHFSQKKVFVKGKEHLMIDTDAIYTNMYNNFPTKWVKADDGEKYLLFRHKINEFDLSIPNL